MYKPTNDVAGGDLREGGGGWPPLTSEWLGKGMVGFLALSSVLFARAWLGMHNC